MHRLFAANERRLGLALVAVALTTWVACFNPDVKSGALACSGDEAHRCPSGFSCRNDRCWKNDELPGTGGAGGVATGGRGTGGQAGQGGGGQGGGCPSRPARCSEAPASGDVCHPTCQTGACGCTSQCSVNAAGTAACQAMGTKTNGQVCNLAADDCAPGYVCQKESCGVNLGRCYRFCRDGGDCDGVACNRVVKTMGDTATSFRTCDVPPSSCDPIAQTGCPDPSLVCYAVSASSGRCDCPGGNIAEGQPCSLLTACAPKLVCLRSGLQAGTCQRLCRTDKDCARTDGGAPGTCAVGSDVSTCVF